MSIFPDSAIPRDNVIMYELIKQVIIVFCGWLVGCRVKSSSPLVGPGTVGGVPSVCVWGGVFLTYPTSYLREFRRKLQTTRSTSSTEE